jgi:phage repressor protein C with HTH and peptisase S24 domain
MTAKELKRKTAKAIELKSLNAQQSGHVLAMADVAWIARILWASQ